jgi:hypothetical protein
MNNVSVKDIASILNLSETTVRRIAKKMYPDKIKNGVKTEFSLEESENIIRKYYSQYEKKEELSSEKDKYLFIISAYDAEVKQSLLNEFKDLKDFNVLYYHNPYLLKNGIYFLNRLVVWEDYKEFFINVSLKIKTYFGIHRFTVSKNGYIKFKDYYQFYDGHCAEIEKLDN